MAVRYQPDQDLLVILGATQRLSGSNERPIAAIRDAVQRLTRHLRAARRERASVRYLKLALAEKQATIEALNGRENSE